MTKKEIRNLNRRIQNLENRYGETQALKSLRARLRKIGALTNSGLVSTKKLSAINDMGRTAAIKRFAKSKTSTIKGMRAIHNRVKSTVRDVFGDVSLSDEEAEKLANIFYDSDFEMLTTENDLTSDIWDFIRMAKKGVYKSKDEFIDKVSDYIVTGNNVDVKTLLGRLFDKYV